MASVNLYTAPSGETALVKHLSIVNNAALGGLILMRLNGATGASNVYSATIPANGQAQLTPAFLVLQPGDTLSAISSVASMVMSGFGAELEGEAD